MYRLGRFTDVWKKLAFLATGGILLQAAVGCEAIPASLTAGILSSVSDQIIGNLFSIWLGLGEISQPLF